MSDSKLSLSEYLAAVQEVIQMTFEDVVWVKAEIRNLSIKGGHYYLEYEDINTEIQNVSLFSDYTGLIAPYFADPDFVTILGDKAWEPGASYPVLTIPTVVFIGKGSVSLSSNWEGGNKPKSYTNVRDDRFESSGEYGLYGHTVW